MISNSSSVRDVRILVVGDSCVGKTQLVSRLCSPSSSWESNSQPSWTIGCDVNVLVRKLIYVVVNAGQCEKLYQSQQSKERAFIEFFDVGGSRSHRISRHIFYSRINGIIFVFDLTNSNSFENVRKWIRELVLCHQHSPIDQTFGASATDWHLPLADETSSPATSASVSRLGKLPVILVGTKLDVPDAKQPFYRSLYDSVKIMGIENIFVSSVANHFDRTCLNSFFDRVILCRYGFGEQKRSSNEADSDAKFSPTSILPFNPGLSKKRFNSQMNNATIINVHSEKPSSLLPQQSSPFGYSSRVNSRSSSRQYTR